MEIFVGNKKMTAQQIAEKFGYSVNSIETKFKRTQQAIKKKYNIEIIKCQGINGVYYIISDDRAKTMFDEVKNELYIPLESLKIENFACYVLIGIAATPQGFFRGTKKDLLKYIGVSPTAANQSLIQGVLDLWSKLNIIVYDIQEDVVSAHMRLAFEKAQVIPIQMLKECQKICQENHKQNLKIVQLVKVWQAHRLCEKAQPFTIQDIQQYIDLSKDQIKDARKLLQENNVFKLNAAMLPGVQNRRIGSNVDLNVFYDNNEVEIQNLKNENQNQKNN